MQAVYALKEVAHLHEDFLVAIEQRFEDENAKERRKVAYKPVYGTNLWNFVAIKIIAAIMKVDTETYKDWVKPVRYTLPVDCTFIMSDVCLHCGSGTPGSRLHAYCNTKVSPASADATTHDITRPGWSSALSCLFRHLFHQ